MMTAKFHLASIFYITSSLGKGLLINELMYIYDGSKVVAVGLVASPLAIAILKWPKHVQAG